MDDDSNQRLRAALLDPGFPVAVYYDQLIYQRIIEAFTGETSIPGMSRIGQYHRAIMLLALNLALQEGRM